MQLQLRPFAFDDADYQAVVAIHNAIYPEYIDTVEEWRHWDGSRPQHCVLDRWIAERDGAAVAYGQLVQWPGMYHPQKFSLYVDVQPDQRRQGIGTRLYEQLYARALEQDAIMLRSALREDEPDSLAFVAKRGYEEEGRTWESRLDLASFEPSKHANPEQALLGKGISITTLAEYMRSEPEYKRKLYDAIMDMVQDVPRPEPFTRPAYEGWIAQIFDDKNLFPEGYFMALHRGEIASVSQIWRSSDPNILNTGLTATRRDYRRMGIALALKLRAASFAQAQGARELRTDNASTNRPMLNINEALGFVRQPAWIEYAKTIRNE